MKHRWNIVLLVGTVSAVLALAQPAVEIDWRVVVPGVEHAQFTRPADAAGEAAGPWHLNVLRVDLARARLDVMAALDAAVGLETVSSMAERHAATAAVNGGYFRTTGTFRGDAIGTLQIDGHVLSEPDRGRAAVGLVRTGQTTRLIFGHVGWDGRVEVGGRHRGLDGVNRPRGPDEVVVFTPMFHRTTLTSPTGTEVVVRDGRVHEIRDAAGSSVIPPDGFVVSATGTARSWARGLRTGAEATVAMGVTPADPSPQNPWAEAEDILGGGPKLVTAGRLDITIARESMQPSFRTDRHPRTAIAALEHGRALLVVVDGRQLQSVGMSLDELAHLLIELGAVEAMNLDGGGSTTMVVQGKVVNRPSDPSGERPVSDAMVIR